MSNLSMKLDKIAALLQEMIARMDAHQKAVAAEPLKQKEEDIEADRVNAAILSAKRGPGRPRKNV